MGLFLMMQRELRVLARSPVSVRIRFFTILGASVVLGLLMLVFSMAQSVGMRNSGEALFGVLIFYSCGLILIGGTFLTSDAIARERREGTLGFLFLTDLRGIEVVLGKWLGLSANAFLTLLALAPITAVCILFGGVTFARYGRVELALFNLLFFTTALGLCLSCFFQDGIKAGWRALLALVVLTVVFPFVDRLWPGAPLGLRTLDPLAPVYSAERPYSPPSPTVYYNVSSTTVGTNTTNKTSVSFGVSGGSITGAARPASGRGAAFTGPYFTSLAGSHLLAWGLLVLGGWRARAGWIEEEPGERAARRWAGWLGRTKRAQEAPKILPPRAQVTDRPIGWLVGRSSRDRAMLWTAAGFSAALSALGVYVTPLMGLTGTLGPFLLLLLAGLRSARFFADARRTGALELIVCTPLSDDEILKQHSAALWNSLFAPAMLVFGAMALAWVTIMAGGAIQPVFPPFSAFQSLYFVYYVLSFAAGLPAMIWMGTWLSLKNERPERAGLLAVLFVLLLPAVAVCVPSLLVRLVLWGVARGACSSGVRHFARARARTA